MSHDKRAPLEEIQDHEVDGDESARVAEAQAVNRALEQQAGVKNAAMRKRVMQEISQQDAGDDLVAELKAKNDIFTLYDKLIGGKTMSQWGSRPDGNLASCPMPGHTDKNPSASFSSDGLWKCFSCESAGDAIDLYAIYQGMPVPSYRSSPTDFRECLENAAIMEGIEISWQPEDDGGDYDDDDMDAIYAHVKAGGSIAPVSSDPSDRATSEPEESLKSARVRLELESSGINLAPPDTFLGEWMNAHAVSLERSPMEYHFFCGLAALGIAGARNIYLDDPQGDIFGNLGLVLYGHTGARKSAAIKNMNKLLEMFSPHDPDDKNCTGVRALTSPASGEALLDEMRRVDGSGNDQEDGDPVTGVLSLDELEGLMKVMNRQGSTLQDVVMQFLDGNAKVAVTSRGAGRRQVRDGILSFVTATQPNAVQGYLGQGVVNNGLLNRFIFVYGEPARRQIDSTKVDVQSSSSKLTAVAAWAERTKSITASRDVMIKLIQVAEEVIDPILAEGDNHLLNRIELHHKRLAFLFALNDMSHELKIKHVDMATHVITSFVVPTFNSADEDLDRRSLSQVMGDITEYVSEKFDGEEYDKLTRGRIRANLRSCRRFPDIVDRAFDLLIKEEVIAERKLEIFGHKKRLLPFDDGNRIAVEEEDARIDNPKKIGGWT